MLRFILGLGVVVGSSALARAAPVVGGTRVPIGKWRDVVLVINESSTCSGTLIAPDIVLTAGHCVDAKPIEVLTDTIDYARPGGDRIAVKWARAYPNWEHRYDVGVLMLEHVARGHGRTVASACTINAALEEPNASVHVVGFGLASSSGDDENSALREADLPVIDPFCAMDVACEPSVAPHGEFIAGGRGTDSCFGDSGGPVYLETPDGPALAGVVSRGLALPGAPCGNGGVYVRADKVVAWVQSITHARLTRTSCGGRADDGGTGEAEGGGCSSGGSGAGLVIGLGIFAVGATSRRRPRPDPRGDPRPLDPPSRQAVDVRRGFAA
ncbi:MAG: trypsin-like serine protease [Kofleriaceae bacterium]